MTFRSQSALLVWFIQEIIQFSIGAHRVQKSANFIAKAKPHNEDYTDATFKYFERLMIILIFTRLALFLISLKYPWVIKLAVYFHFFKELVFEVGLPMDRGIIAIEILYSRNILSFIMYYFEFLPSTACAMITSLAQIPASQFLYGKEIMAMAVFDSLSTCISQYFGLLCIHITMTQIGMLYVRAELLAIGND